MNDGQIDKGLSLLERFVTAYETDVSVRHAEALARNDRAAKSDAMIDQLLPLATQLIAQSFGGPVGVPNAKPADVVDFRAASASADAEPDTGLETPAAKSNDGPAAIHIEDPLYAGQNQPKRG